MSEERTMAEVLWNTIQAKMARAQSVGIPTFSPRLVLAFDPVNGRAVAATAHPTPLAQWTDIEKFATALAETVRGGEGSGMTFRLDKYHAVSVHPRGIGIQKEYPAEEREIWVEMPHQLPSLVTFDAWAGGWAAFTVERQNPVLTGDTPHRGMILVRVSLPRTVWQFPIVFGKTGNVAPQVRLKNTRVFALNSRGGFALLNTGNVHAHGAVCWGESRVKHLASPDEVRQYFYTSSFNADLQAETLGRFHWKRSISTITTPLITGLTRIPEGAFIYPNSSLTDAYVIEKLSYAHLHRSQE